MENIRKSDLDFGAIGWGAFFIWWGVTELVPSLPEGIGAIGVGLILLGVNLAATLAGLPTSRFTITLGLIALVFGGLQLANSVLHLPFALPVFPILLLTLGALILVSVVLPGKK